MSIKENDASKPDALARLTDAQFEKLKALVSAEESRRDKPVRKKPGEMSNQEFDQWVNELRTAAKDNDN